MRRGFVTFEGMGYERPFQFAADHGFDHVELQMTYVAGGTPFLGREYLADRRDEIVDILAETGVDLLIHLPHTMDIGAASPLIRAASVEETVENMQVAADLGAEKCVIHPVSSARARGWERSTVQSFIIESMLTLLDHADDLALDLCMENLRYGGFKIDDFDRYFDETDGLMTLDTGHARITGMSEDRMAAFIESNVDRIGHVHASDNKKYVIGFDGTIGDDHAPTGVGDLDFSTALKPLLDGWDGTLSLEIHTQRMEYLAVAKRVFDEMLPETG